MDVMTPSGVRGLMEGYRDKEQLMTDWGISLNTLRKYENMKDGLVFVKIGNKRWYHDDDIRAFLERRKHRPNPSRK